MADTAEFLKPYTYATQFTINGIAGDVKLVEGASFPLKKTEKLGIGISGNVAMICDRFEAVMAIGFPTDTYLKLVSKMLGEEYKTLTHDIEDAAGEITNMVYGHSKKVLEQQGFKMEKAIPTVIRGEDHSISFRTAAPVVVVPYSSELGKFFVLVCVQRVG